MITDFDDFGRNVARKVSSKGGLFFSSHLPVASALPGKHDSQKVHLLYLNVVSYVCQQTHKMHHNYHLDIVESPYTGNESVPKIITNDTLIFFLSYSQHFGNL